MTDARCMAGVRPVYGRCTAAFLKINCLEFSA